MTDISINDVRHLAQLSSLQLADDNEAVSLQKDLAEIINYINQLSELDTAGVEPTYQVIDVENVWRDDVIDTYGLSREDLLALSPDKQANQIKVPKVL